MSNNAAAPLPTETPEWQTLLTLSASARQMSIHQQFENDPQRFDKFHVAQNGALFDFSKHLITDEILAALTGLLSSCGFEEKRAAMVSGEAINLSENRAVLHTVLRGTGTQKEGAQEFVKTSMHSMMWITNKIRTDNTIKDVIHIGIGGSHVGPALAYDALKSVADGPKLHFISNIDGAFVKETLSKCSPDSTAVIIASKTFTTQETMANAHVVKDWISGTQNLYAISDNTDGAQSFGVPADHILPMRDWIGGRYSVWSSIGLPVAIAIGFENFTHFLRGAADADQHFLLSPPENNIPVLMALLGVWYRNFMDYRAQAILPYAQGLAKFPLYLQQVDMESNGKSVSNQGAFIDYKTGPVVFGEAGTDAQHTFMQCLHQGTDVIPADFILFKNANHDLHGHHTMLNANALAQSKALMDGQENQAEPHRHFPGNRPSSTLILEEQNPYNLGLLMAFYEHKIFTQGAIWGINSFDQWGVELGKTNAKTILEALKAENTSIKTDSSTKSLLSHLCGKNTKNL